MKALQDMYSYLLLSMYYFLAITYLHTGQHRHLNLSIITAID